VARPKGLKTKRNARALQKLTVDICGSWKKRFAKAVTELQPWHTNAEETRIIEVPHLINFSENKTKIYHYKIAGWLQAWFCIWKADR
jgi:hypothetical protein